MPVVFPVFQHSTAQSIVSAIRRLKTKRFNHEISRAKFLADYVTLRQLLHDTDEYKQLRRKVIVRSQGLCEKCKKVPGTEMCHKIGVSFRPDLALRMDNVYWGCLSCHALDHPDMNLVR